MFIFDFFSFFIITGRNNWNVSECMNRWEVEWRVFVFPQAEPFVLGQLEMHDYLQTHWHLSGFSTEHTLTVTPWPENNLTQITGPKYSLIHIYLPPQELKHSINFFKLHISVMSCRISAGTSRCEMIHHTFTHILIVQIYKMLSVSMLWLCCIVRLLSLIFSDSLTVLQCASNVGSHYRCTF